MTLGPAQYLLLTWLTEDEFPDFEKAEVFGPFNYKEAAEVYYNEHFDRDIIYRISSLYPII